MITINKTNKEQYCQCTSCQCENKEIDVYKVEIGKDKQQTITFRLCYECICDFVGKAVINR